MSLKAHFNSLSDAELLERIRDGRLTDEAMTIAIEEAQSRQLPEDTYSPKSVTSAAEQYEGDLVLLVRGLSPQEAQVLTGFLAAAGIAADAGDTNLVQTNALLSIAVGGASVRVPESRLGEAKELLVAFRRGDFELGDDFDPNETAA